jgi:NAD(P)-dependent dehydrogenase (short-subunit alcohol dehydrogenase family)
MVGRDVGRLHRFVRKGAEAFPADMTNEAALTKAFTGLADLNRLYEIVSKRKGQIDVVFANAGVGEFIPFGAITEEHFDKLFNINVRGTLFTVQKAVRRLRRQ